MQLDLGRKARTMLQRGGGAEVDAAQVAHGAVRVLARNLALQQQVLRLQVPVHHAPISDTFTLKWPSCLRMHFPLHSLRLMTRWSLTRCP